MSILKNGGQIVFRCFEILMCRDSGAFNLVLRVRIGA